MRYDRLGRRRPAGQERGLRPSHPVLPHRWKSRVVRLAMPEDDWLRLDAMARIFSVQSETEARAYGQAVSELLHLAEDVVSGQSDGQPVHWMDWERQKTLRLIHWT